MKFGCSKLWHNWCMVFVNRSIIRICFISILFWCFLFAKILKILYLGADMHIYFPRMMRHLSIIMHYLLSDLMRYFKVRSCFAIWSNYDFFFPGVLTSLRGFLNYEIRSCTVAQILNGLSVLGLWVLLVEFSRCLSHFFFKFDFPILWLFSSLVLFVYFRWCIRQLIWYHIPMRLVAVAMDWLKTLVFLLTG